MMTGSVSQLHALISVRFRQQSQLDLAIEFVVDTGFTGGSTLPEQAASALGLLRIGTIPANLATDETVEVPVYVAVIVWNGTDRPVRVLATGVRPLLGTGLLSGHELRVEFREGGQVSVTPIE